MYETEGPCPASSCQVGQLPGRTGTGGRHQGQVPVRDRLPGFSHASGVAPRWCPPPAVNAFLLPSRPRRKTFQSNIQGIFAIHTVSTGTRQLSAVIRQFSTGLLTAYAQVTLRYPENTKADVAACNRLVFSSDFWETVWASFDSYGREKVRVPGGRTRVRSVQESV